MDRPTGTIVVRYAGRAILLSLGRSDDGVASVRLPAKGKGTYSLVLSYDPNGSSERVLTGAKSKEETIRVR